MLAHRAAQVPQVPFTVPPGNGLTLFSTSWPACYHCIPLSCLFSVRPGHPSIHTNLLCLADWSDLPANAKTSDSYMLHLLKRYLIFPSLHSLYHKSFPSFVFSGDPSTGLPYILHVSAFSHATALALMMVVSDSQGWNNSTTIRWIAVKNGATSQSKFPLIQSISQHQ